MTIDQLTNAARMAVICPQVVKEKSIQNGNMMTWPQSIILCTTIKGRTAQPYDFSCDWTVKPRMFANANDKVSKGY